MIKLFISVLLISWNIASAQKNSSNYNEFNIYSIEIRKGNGFAYIDDIIQFNRSGLYIKYKNIKKTKIYEIYVEYPKVERKDRIRMNINRFFNTAKDFERCMASDYFSPGAGISLYSIILRKGNEFKVLYVEPCLLSKFKELIILLISQLPNKHREYLQNNFVRCFADQNEFDCFQKGEY